MHSGATTASTCANSDRLTSRSSKTASTHRVARGKGGNVVRKFKQPGRLDECLLGELAAFGEPLHPAFDGRSGGFNGSGLCVDKNCVRATLHGNLRDALAHGACAYHSDDIAGHIRSLHRRPSLTIVEFLLSLTFRNEME